MKIFTHIILATSLIITPTLSTPKLHIHLKVAPKKDTESVEITPAADGKNSDVVQALVNKALLESVQYNNIENAIAALQHGAHINTTDEFGFTPLLHAIFNNQIDLAIMLIKNGAHVNAKNIYGITPLIAAAAINNPEMTHILLTYTDTDINTIDNNGNNALHHATEHGWNSQTVKLLVASGCAINVQNKRGNTPLYHAVKYKNSSVVKLFLQNNANPNIANRKGITPLMKAAEQNDAQKVKLLLENGADVCAQDIDGLTALMHTIITEKVKNKSNQLEIIQILLDKKAPVNATNIYGDTALLFAAVEDNFDIIKLLVAAGANPLIKRLSGHTAMDAIMKQSGKHIEKVLFAKNND